MDIDIRQKLRAINNFQKTHKSHKPLDIEYEFEDSFLYDILAGKIPLTNIDVLHSDTPEIQNAIYKFISSITKYRFDDLQSKKQLEKNKETLLSLVSKETQLQKHLNQFKSILDNRISYHKSCLIEGEGGAGKSWFIYKLTDKLQYDGIDYLCLFSTSKIDISQVTKLIDIILKTGPIVLILDGFNEYQDNTRKTLSTKIHQWMLNDNFRMIITIKDNSLDEEELLELKQLATKIHRFKGLSMKSVIQATAMVPAKYLALYEDLIYSQNAQLTTSLIKVFTTEDKYKFSTNKKLNTISRITNIMEQAIKATTADGVNTWNYFKNNIVNPLFDKYVKAETRTENPYKSPLEITIEEKDITKQEYIHELDSHGFIRYSRSNGKYNITVGSETLASYLWARRIMVSIQGKHEDNTIIDIIENMNLPYYMQEITILAVYSVFEKDDLSHFFNICAGLNYGIKAITITRTKIKKDKYKLFKKFLNNWKLDDFITFGGKSNPFNCTEYYNSLFQDKIVQLQELPITLLDNQDALHSKLYNMCILAENGIYTDEEIQKEVLYFSIWSSASPTLEIRILAAKTMYAILIKSTSMLSVIEDIITQIHDRFILISIMQVLTALPKDIFNNEVLKIITPFIKDRKFISATCFDLFANYLKNPGLYIAWNKIDLMKKYRRKSPTKALSLALTDTSLKDKFLMPLLGNRIHCYFQSGINERNLSRNKSYLKLISQQNQITPYVIVTPNEDYPIPMMELSARLSSSLQNTFNAYGLTTTIIQKQRQYDFFNSPYMKAIAIASDIFFGSIMCNYHFMPSYNNRAELLDYHTFYKKLMPSSVISRQNLKLDNIDRILLSNLQYPYPTPEWNIDFQLTFENIKTCCTPIENESKRWIFIGGDIYHYPSRNDYSTFDIIHMRCTTKKLDFTSVNEPCALMNKHENNLNITEWHHYSIEESCMLESSEDSNSDTNVLVPPSTIIKVLSLKLNSATLSYDKNKEPIIILDNRNHFWLESGICNALYIEQKTFEKLQSFPLYRYIYVERMYRNRKYQETTGYFEILPDNTWTYLADTYWKKALEN